MMILAPYVSSLEQLSDTRFDDETTLFQSYVEFIAQRMESDVCYMSISNEKGSTFDRHYCSHSGLETYPSASKIYELAEKKDLWRTARQNDKIIINNAVAWTTSEKTNGEKLPDLDHHINSTLKTLSSVSAVIGVGRSPLQYREKDRKKFEFLLSTSWDLVQEKSNEIRSKNLKSIENFEADSNHNTLRNLLSAISKALELRDSYTSFHMQNVSSISVSIGKELKLSSHMLQGLELGALIHDIGKIAMPSEILNKPGQISSVEFDLLKTHTTLGGLMFKQVELPWPIQNMILQHHERLDGSGYPSGLRASEICMEAKIIAVADTFDAISADRPYRFAPGPQRAIEEITQGRGIKFDPYVVDAFISIYQRDPTLNGVYDFENALH